jgi:uncharacterized MnhB-related membrane protein
MAKLHSEHISHLKTTIVGILLIVAALAYIIFMEDTSIIIFFGSLGIGISLLFLPDTLISGLESLIKKNQNKEL